MKGHLLIVLYILLLSCSTPPGPSQPPHGGKVAPGEDHTGVDTLAISSSATIAPGAYTVTFSPADSMPLPDFLENQGVKISGGQRVYFHKTGPELWLYLSGGDSTMLHDRDVATYFFVAHLPLIDHYLIRVQYPEGNSYLLVSRRSGAQKDIWGFPFVSPSRRQLFVINSDVVAGHTPNGFQLLTRRGDSLHLEFSVLVRDWGPGAVRWLSDSSLLLQRLYPVHDTVRSRLHFRSVYSRLTIRKRRESP
ncbi:MAG TPA: hypothetical protein VGN63_04020 [Flavisolibacter sp.]|jgi:hypothetical protein|nr:hypothetical protein [Flavisolibacter sp.]